MSVAQGRPEIALLLCCARTELSPRQRDQVRGLAVGTVNWRALLDAASRHGLQPLLYWQLAHCCPEVVPAAYLAELHDYYQANRGRNLLLTGELVAILALFNEWGIPAIPFKGPVLAAALYGDVALREFGDLDLFVRRRDVPRVGELLQARGYYKLFRLSSSQEAASLQSPRGQYSLVHAQTHVVVDLHWEFTLAFLGAGLEPEGVWERLGAVEVAGRQLPTLCPEDLLLILCLHGAKHCWERLEMVCAVAELVGRYPDLAWGQVLAEARRLGESRMVFVALLLAHDLLGAQVPEAALARARADDGAAGVARDIADSLRKGTPPARGRFSELMLHLRTMESRRDRLGYGLRLAVPTIEDRALLPLPRGLGFLYYPLRLIRLVGTHVASR
jgi:hypothetical protein